MVRAGDDDGGLAAERVGHEFDEALAGAQVAGRDPAGVRQLVDERVVAADEHGRGLARGGLDFVQPADQRHGQAGGLETQAGGEIGHALGATSRHHDHPDPGGDVASREESVRGVDVGEVEVAAAAAGARGAAARGPGFGQGREDDPASARADGERGQAGQAKVGRIGPGGVVAEALPGEELQLVERVGSAAGVGAGLEPQIGVEMDAACGRIERGAGVVERCGGRRGVGRVQPGGQFVADFGERGT